MWDLVEKDNDGNTVATPNWKLVLHYEFAIRKDAYRKMAEGAGDFRQCLKRAWLDPQIKERHFTTPLAIASANGVAFVNTATSSKNPNKRTVDEAGWHNDRPTTKGKRGKKGKGKKGAKGKGKGLAGGGAKGCSSSTPDGRSICYGYNDENQRRRKKNCNLLHVCGRCFQKHPMYACSGNGKQTANALGMEGPETRDS